MRTWLSMCAVAALAMTCAGASGCVTLEAPPADEHAADAGVCEATDEAASAWCFRALECGFLGGVDVDTCVADLVDLAPAECGTHAEATACRRAVQALECSSLYEYPAACTGLLEE